MSRTSQLVLVSLGLVALTAIAYAPVGANDFVDLDDEFYVTKNPHVRYGLTPEAFHYAWTTFAGANWHPLTWLSLQADASLFGIDPRGFHFTNLVLHIA